MPLQIRLTVIGAQVIQAHAGRAVGVSSVGAVIDGGVKGSMSRS
jgi:hypothetical protein